MIPGRVRARAGRCPPLVEDNAVTSGDTRPDTSADTRAAVSGYGARPGSSEDAELRVRTAVSARLDALAEGRYGLVAGERFAAAADGVAVAGMDLDRAGADTDTELEDPVRLWRAGPLALGALGLAALLVGDPAAGHVELLLLDAEQEPEFLQPRHLFGHAFESSGLGRCGILSGPTTGGPP